MYIYVYIYVYICTYVYMYICIYVYMYSLQVASYPFHCIIQKQLDPGTPFQPLLVFPLTIFHGKLFDYRRITLSASPWLATAGDLYLRFQTRGEPRHFLAELLAGSQWPVGHWDFPRCGGTWLDWREHSQENPEKTQNNDEKKQ